MKKINFLSKILFVFALIFSSSLAFADVTLVDNGVSSFTLSGMGTSDYHRVYYWGDERLNNGSFGLSAFSPVNTDSKTFTLPSTWNNTWSDGMAKLVVDVDNNDYCSSHSYSDCLLNGNSEYYFDLIQEVNGDIYSFYVEPEPESPAGISVGTVQTSLLDGLSSYGIALVSILGAFIGLALAYFIFRWGWKKLKSSTN